MKHGQTLSVQNWIRFSYHEVVLSALGVGGLDVEVGELELDLPPLARLTEKELLAVSLFHDIDTRVRI